MVRSLKRRCNNYITELEIAIDKIVTPAINTPTKTRDTRKNNYSDKY